MDSILFILAAICFAVCAAWPKAAWKAASAGCGCVLICLALFVAQVQIAGNLHIGYIAAAFTPLAVAVLLLIDRKAGFRRSWQIIPAVACVSALAALLPLSGHSLVTTSPLLWMAHAFPAALSYACFAVAITQLLDVHAATEELIDSAAAEPASGLPLLKMETSAFRTVYFAFAVLSATLVSGIILNHIAENPLIEFNHKHLFAVLTWLASLVLIVGRLARGWRGSTALYWLAAAGIFLLLSYMGTLFVLDIILDK